MFATASVCLRRTTAALFVLAVTSVASTASATETTTAGALPWEGPLNQIADSLSGPVIRVVGILAILGISAAIAVGAGGGAMKSGLQVVLALTIGATAVSFGLPFLGFGLSL